MDQYKITGMSCAACSARVEKAVRGLPGVESCAVNLLTNSMAVEGSAGEQEIIDAVRKAGYGAARMGGNTQTGEEGLSPEEDLLDNREFRSIRKRLVVSAAFLLVLLYCSMGVHMLGFPLPAMLAGSPAAQGILQMVLCLVIMAINRTFFISGFRGLLHRAPNMDTLVALGSGASFVYSICCLFAVMAGKTEYFHQLYFESAAMILVLITVGKMLEAYSKGRTTDALKGLMDLSPKTARLIRDGKEEEVPVGQVMPGDLFAVRPGDSIPVDGIVTEGSGSVDESALTGESMPVLKEAGACVSAGTINQLGYLRCRAMKVGSDTTLSQVIRMVREASATKAPAARIADRVAGVFVPVVMGIALITTLIWLGMGESAGFALSRGISVLVISCPCALGLATPVAIMVGSGVGARNGILFKTAAALEAAGKTKIAAMDKTGTLTMGKPRVTDIRSFGDIPEEGVLAAACSLEAKSEHPIARAVMEKAEEMDLFAEEVKELKAVPGKGLEGLFDGEVLAAGNRKYIEGLAEVPEEAAALSEQLASEGKTPLFVAYNGELLGLLAVADVIREDSRQAVDELKELGIRTVMVTGDNERTAANIAAAAGIDEVISEVLPGEKEETVRRLMEEGRTAMVGDGINDAPALTRADTGIAIGGGTDIAIDAGDVVLMKDSLKDVPSAIRLSRATLRNIKQNLFWAFFYNIIAIPLAAGVFIPLTGWTLNPMVAAAAMSLSSFCVVTNALRLNLVRI
ncbi:MAG: cadmium-translocating P-type ATPase [Firmicutes bacterium]|nr:cadmium-translocating P-type ATPase [Bacillota bacterium]